MSVERGWRWEEEVRREKRARNTKRQTRTMIRDVPHANKLLGKLWESKKKPGRGSTNSEVHRGPEEGVV